MGLATIATNILAQLQSVPGFNYTTFASTFTALSQESENRDDELVIVRGAGDKHVYSGQGNDLITSYGGE